MCAQILVETTYISFQLTSRDSIQNHFLSVTIITKLNPTSPKCLKMPRIATQESKAYTSNDLVSISSFIPFGCYKEDPTFLGTIRVRVFDSYFVFNTIPVYIPCSYLHTYANCISIVQNGTDPKNHLCYILAFTHQILAVDENYNFSIHRCIL